MRLAAPPDYLAAYLAHVEGGHSMRDLARRSGVNASTILRRVRVIEDLRDNPEWSAILDALALAPEASGAETPEGLLAALGLKPGDLTAAFAPPGAPLSDALAVAVTAEGLAWASVMVAGAPSGRVARAVVLAAVGLGWLRLASPVAGRLRSYAPSMAEVRAALRPVAALPVWPDDFPAVAVHRRNPELIGQDLLGASQAFALLWTLREAQARGRYEALREAMPPRLFAALEIVCGERRGVEAMEAEMGLPARSGKVLLAAALDVARHSGALA